MTRSLRLLATLIIGGLVTLGVFADQRERELEVPVVPTVLGTPDVSVGTWFCAGGSAETGIAAVGLELVNVGGQDAAVEVIAVRDDQIGEERVEVVALRRAGPLSTSLSWPRRRRVGARRDRRRRRAVEQTFDGLSGTDRAPAPIRRVIFAADGATCITPRAKRWSCC